MKGNEYTKTTINIIHSAIALFALACLAFSPQARAVCQDACLTNDNTVQGDNALISLTTGIENTAVGVGALQSNSTGNNNTADGSFALASNNTDDNTAIGTFALLSNTTGNPNTAIGVDALESNTIGGNNTATGAFALNENADGNSNTATGVDALLRNIGGSNNTATGVQALLNNSTGNSNTATGWNALLNNTTGTNNTAEGNQALLNNTTGSFNIAIGNGAGGNLTTGINNIDIGNNGVAGESRTIRIGTNGTQSRTFIAGIAGATVSGGTTVFIRPNGQLGTITSSRRFKDAIKPIDKASEAILALKPVTFCYKNEIDPERTPQFGLVAEDVEKVNPDLVARDTDGKPYTVRYEAVNAMLLNEFLKAHQKIEEQGALIAQQQKEIQALTAGLKKQASQIQKVSARLELQKPSAPTLADSQ